MEPIQNAIIGGLAGLLVAVAGALKDSPYEGFKSLTFIRSPLIGFFEAPLLARSFPDINPVLLFLSTIATERITVESWKLVRTQMPGKFEVGEWGVPKERL